MKFYGIKFGKRPVTEEQYLAFQVVAAYAVRNNIIKMPDIRKLSYEEAMFFRLLVEDDDIYDFFFGFSNTGRELKCIKSRPGFSQVVEKLREYQIELEI